MLKFRKDFRDELKLTTRIGLPLALGELGWMSTYLVDALMLGHLPHSAVMIAASSLGNTIYYALVFCVIRGLDGVMTLVAQSYGASDVADCLYTLTQSVFFIVVGTPLVMLATMSSLWLLPHFGTSPELVAETHTYLRALIWSTAPLLLYMAIRRYLQSINRVALVTLSLITAGLVNLLFDWVLLYGRLGASPMGIAGSGWATCIVRFWMMALLVLGLVFALKDQRLRVSWQQFRPNGARLRSLARIGWPSALENITDLGFSTWMSIVCTRLGTVYLAAHQVVLDLDAFVYMVPLGLSYATVARVGQSFGKVDGYGSSAVPRVRRSANASLFLGMSYIAVASLLFAGFPRLWGGLYSNDPAVVAAAAPIFLVCGILQLGDAANVIFSSALTGLGDTRTPFLANTVISWLLGAPLGWFLAFHTGLALTGLWLGRAAAAILTGGLMAVAWQLRLRAMKRENLRSHRESRGLLHVDFLKERLE